MRTSNEQKAATRQRIMEQAGRLFRRHGIDGVGVDAVMHEAGLTHGGFYGHFASKEALAAEVCADALTRSAARWERIRSENHPDAALALIVENYLGAAYLQDSERGCVVPVLGAELARKEGSRPALTDALRVMIDALAACLPRRRRRPARERAMAKFATMVGAVLLARLSCDPAFSAEILDAARAEVGGED